MFIKVLTRKTASYSQLIDYIFRDKPEMRPLISQNLRGVSKDSWIEELTQSESNRTNRRKDNIALYHEIMSFHQGSSEQLTDEKLQHLAYEYAKSRNPNAHVLASVHHDTDNVHIHFLVSATEYASGKATRLSKDDLRNLKEHMQEVQQEHYPELSDSLIDFSQERQYQSEREEQLRLKSDKPLTKDVLQTTLTDVFTRAFSREEFISRLQSDHDIEIYERNGKPTGVVYNNQKFRFSTLDFDSSSLEQLDQIEQDLNSLEVLRSPDAQTQELNTIDRLEELEEEIESAELNAESEPQPAPEKAQVESSLLEITDETNLLSEELTDDTSDITMSSETKEEIRASEQDQEPEL